MLSPGRQPPFQPGPPQQSLLTWPSSPIASLRSCARGLGTIHHITVLSDSSISLTQDRETLRISTLS